MKKTIEILAYNVRAIRLGNGMTLGKLSGRARLARPCIGFIEKKLYNPSMEALDRIAQALGVPLWMLFHPRALKLLEKNQSEDAKTPELQE